MVKSARPAKHNILNIIMIEKFKITIVKPAGILRPMLHVTLTAVHQNDFLVPRHPSDIIKYTGGRKCVFLLCKQPVERTGADFFLIISASHYIESAEKAFDLLMAVAHLPKQRNSGHYIVYVKYAFVQELIMPDSARVADINCHLLNVYVFTGVIVFRCLESTCRTECPSDVVISEIFVFKPVVTFRADLQIINQVDAVLSVRIHFRDSKVCARIFRRYAAGN